MLIENAKLLATLDGKDAVIVSKNETIGELKDDRKFIREELVDRRKYSSDATKIAQQMLTTMERMALRGALPEGSDPQPGRRQTIASEEATGADE